MRWPRKRHITPIQQMEAAECGVACLAMVLDYFGSSIPLAELRKLCGTSRDGNSALHLLESAERLGLEGQGTKLTPDELRNAKGPLILHWRLNHFVVFVRHRFGEYTLADPATGFIKVDYDECSKCFSGIALHLQPTSRLVPRRPRHSSVARYFHHLKTGWRTLGFVLIAGAASQLLASIAPAMQQVLIDEVIAPLRSEWLLPVLALQVALVVAAFSLTWLSRNVLLTFQTALSAKLTTAIGSRLLRLPLEFLEARSRGDLVLRVTGYSQLGNLMTATTRGLLQLVFALCLATLMVAYNPQLGALALGVDTVRIALLRHLRADIRQRAAGELTARAAASSTILQAASAGEVVEAFGIQDKLQRWYERRLTEQLRWSRRTRRLSHGASSWLGAFDGAAQGLIYWVGGLAVVQAEMTIGVYAGFLAIRTLLRVPLSHIVDTAECWVELRGLLNRTDELVEEPEIQRGDKAVGRSPTLQLRNVGFRYSPHSPWLFRGVNLTFSPNESTTFIGPSGQGKSTLLRIAAGLLVPTEGEVLLDGAKISSYRPESLARAIGAVLESAPLVPETLRKNLCLRIPDAEEPDLLQACEKSCFTEVLRSLPTGLDTVIDPQQPALSGGERQRLGLTQALVASPSLVLLDEATCFLDAAKEAQVLNGLLRSETTVISVAHRRAVIERSDYVYLVNGGDVCRIPRDRSNATATVSKSREPTPAAISRGDLSIESHNSLRSTANHASFCHS